MRPLSPAVATLALNILLGFTSTSAFVHTASSPRTVAWGHGAGRPPTAAFTSTGNAAAAEQQAAAAPAPPAAPAPTNFREAEVLGLRYMQEGDYERALNAFQRGMKLSGSRVDVVRTKMLSGPSPVGGSQGGTEGKVEMRLDEFELQAAHYNIACAYAKLGNVPEAIANIKMAFDSGFDNYATVRADPDLSAVHGTAEFDNLMNTYDKKKGFPNPFSFLG
mmetsp:Transcript_35725/g.106615  ORF Transcript_35725/g.106615 Transcript_35725/m.106615 type:complete len:220 (-) Transcript_35725:415-1074(-)|eukprot:CAMPEP_0113542666 /NCGR_PEP_ID=MMETSP0015_2-20120614/9735_1 /TAXON_ID=2838 /ORGANISM="Odontella" /LENGTH=219 /DNA_ID=CAMNT_0000442751 /DNA_START=207 /DNA_END=866 /DNA_ORIENTATION=+ /assembly_acc=CAM_ASM_000160